MEQTGTSAYDEILQLNKDIFLFESGINSINWDSSTILPAGARAQRAELGGFLGKTWQRMVSNPKFGELLDVVLNSSDYELFDAVQKRNIYLTKKRYETKSTLPDDFMGRLSKQTSIARQKWVKALKKKDWKIFEPDFERVFKIQVECADYLMDVVGVSNSYDYHFNWWEEGMRASEISKVFADITKIIRPMIEKYAPQTESIRTDFLTRHVPKKLLRALTEAIAEVVGYDTKSENAVGLIGETLHPFSTGRYDNVRIALRFTEDYPLFSYRCTLHECGHALYMNNLNRDLMYQPVRMTAGFGIHESQAKFLEYMIGFSPEFLEYFLPKFNDITGGTFSDVTPVEFARAFSAVKPGPIRGKADELTFTMHIIIRFEIERDLFAGKIEVSDVPVVWNELYERYLGVEVKNDAEGALQDMQWPAGQFGHFPCHTLGNIFAAQFTEKLSKDIPDWRDQMREGKVREAIGWMTENVHKQGSRYDAPELIERVTGSTISAEPYLNYLKGKFKVLYQ